MTEQKPFRVTIEQWGNKVVIEKPHSDVTLDDAVEMMRSALIAVGYHPDSVKDYFAE